MSDCKRNFSVIDAYCSPSGLSRCPARLGGGRRGDASTSMERGASDSDSDSASDSDSDIATISLTQHKGHTVPGTVRLLYTKNWHKQPHTRPFQEW